MITLLHNMLVIVTHLAASPLVWVPVLASVLTSTVVGLCSLARAR